MRRAFTLIEAMIATALGMLVIMAAYAGFRAATQSVAIAGRLATENALIRAGWRAALDEADYWTLCDAPANPARQQLRAYDAASRRALPFTPFRDSFPRASGSDVESERGWDDAYEWPAADPRTWFHGNCAERRDWTRRLWGRYELFEHLAPTVALTKVWPNGAAYGTVAPRHGWLPNQIESLKDALGYYGMCDYLPADTIFGFHGDPGPDGIDGTADDDAETLSGEMVGRSYPTPIAPWTFANGDGTGLWCSGLYYHTRGTAISFVPASPLTEADTAAMTTAQLLPLEAQLWRDDPIWNGWDVPQMLAVSRLRQPLVPLAPSHWPDASFSVVRVLSHRRYGTQCTVEWRDPVSGVASQLSFTTFATSLRGARRQRGRDGGWAAPGAPTLDSY